MIGGSSQKEKWDEIFQVKRIEVRPYVELFVYIITFQQSFEVGSMIVPNLQMKSWVRNGY